MRYLLPALLLAALSVCLQAEESMSYLDNSQVKVGVDLKLGGAITYLARAGGENIVNNYDHGRQIQLSFYSGPVPYSAGEKHPAPHWEHLGWNPIQAGDDFKHGSRVLEHRNDGSVLYVTCVPLQWPLDNVPGECTFESWLELDGGVVKGRARLNNARADHQQYPARLQELPALYANAPYHRVITYSGGRPFTNEAPMPAPMPQGRHPWASWNATEQWAALLDDHDQGIGLITPGRVWFTGGFAGKPGPNDTKGATTGYLAGQAQEVIDHDIVYEYRYEIVPGSLEEIRARARLHRPEGLPVWTFNTDRQGWHHVNAADTGWRLQGQWELQLEKDDPQFISPMVFWRAEDAPYVIIEAAVRSRQKQAVVFWQGLGDDHPKDSVKFALDPDGAYHRYAVKLADAPEYKGGMVRLRFDPVGSGAPGEWIKVKRIALAKEEK